MGADRFDKIVLKTLAHEGGYVNDPRDPGGETNMGISKRFCDKAGIKDDLKTITKARVIEIYRWYFWEKPKIYLIYDDALAGKVFDLAVNCGESRAIKFLQRALGNVTVDGVMGNNTATAANRYNSQAELLAKVKEHAKAYYVSLNKPHYLKGWLRRLES